MSKINTDREVVAKFKPRARLLLQLGDQLIKNESIALIELAKNSYDADANKVDITMTGVDLEDGGTIVIEDDGTGMTLDIVENVWLEPGSDYKAQQLKEERRSQKYGRLPIGEKGIGRFGVHKLGNIIELTTKSSNTNEVFVRIDWTDFNKFRYLEDIPITIFERSTPQKFTNGKTGTYISISKLRKKWDRGTAREVKRAITSLASPFDNLSSFMPYFLIPDKPEWLEGLLEWIDIKEYALYSFSVTIEGGAIVDFRYDFTPWPTMTKLNQRTIDINNDLVKNFIRLQDEKEHYFSLSPYEIGRIVFKGYIFDLDSFIMKMGVNDKRGVKDYLRQNGGVRVFRDGLRVYDYGEKENDWLGLDYRRFQQPTKSVSNNLILSAVYLDRSQSADLQEKTNREGFVDNEAYQAFKKSILYSLGLIETLRQTDKKKLKEIYGPTSKSEPVMSILDDAIKYVDEKIADSEIKTQIKKYLVKIEQDYTRVTENLLKAAGIGLSMSVVVHEVEKIIYELEKVLKVEKASERVLHLVKHLASLIDGYAEIIRRSAQTNEGVVDVIEQALFNVEYRLSVHNIEVIKKYNDSKNSSRAKVARSLLIGTVMNIIDNSIYWLDQKGFRAIEKGDVFFKKIWIDIQEESGFINVIIADNGTGFLVPTDDIVEPFVSGKPSGMGLGLHIASEVMLAHEGRLIFPEKGDFEIPDEFESGAIVVLSLKK